MALIDIIILRYFMLKIVLSEDMSVVEHVREGLIRNDGYCPCVVKHTKDTKCPCKKFREKITVGLCHCGLYKKVDL
jgi:ferredoxin-thioredoxin reductase catalytic subunit